MLSDILQVSPHDEPEELLAALRGSNDELWDGIPDAWVFRGHANADWELLPTALRKDSKLTHHADRPRGPYDTMSNQVDVESKQVHPEGTRRSSPASEHVRCLLHRRGSRVREAALGRASVSIG
jgi:hypothetical protein